MTEEISPGVYELSGALGDKRLATWLLVGDDGAAVVDTGVRSTPGELIVPALAGLGVAPAEVREVVITHADVDHFGGLAAARRAFPRARLRASAQDRPLIERWESIVSERYGWYRRHGLDYAPAVWEVLPALKGADTLLDDTLAAGDELLFGGSAFEVLELPGHTRGHIGLWEPRRRLAILGDALLGDGVPDLNGRVVSPAPYVTVPAYRATIEAVARLGASRLLTAHWPAGDPAGFVDRSRAHVDRVEEATLDALGSRPLALRSVWEALVHRLGPYPSLAVELARSIHSHLEDLAARGSVHRDGEAWVRSR